jgi:hypothetical protein
VRLLWDDHVGGTHNVTLQLSRVVSSAGGRHTATWYSIVPLGSAFLALDAAAGITAMRFALDGRLEDQDGVGFTAQDDLMFSASSCSNNINGQVSGRVDVAVCGVPFCDVDLPPAERPVLYIYVGARRPEPNARVPRAGGSG